MQVDEIFSSIQGEGIYIGYRQIFLRLSGCNLSCDYCDETGHKSRYYDIDELADEIKSLSKSWHHSISLTGGEPLLQVDRLKLLLPKLDLPVYLETNGTLPDRFSEISDMVDIVSLDLKEGHENEFFKMLDLAKEHDVFIKYVTFRETNIKKLKDLTGLIAEIDKDIPFIIQPVTPHGKIKHGPTEKDILKFYAIAKKSLNEVRVIPQAHKMMGIK